MNSTFENCESTTDGGVVRASNVTRVRVIDSVFQNVHSNGNGGSLLARGCNVSVQRCTFLNSSSSSGGAIFAADFEAFPEPAKHTQMEVTGLVFISCQSETDGGGIMAQKSEMAVIASKFVHSSAGGRGGAISSQGGNMLVDECFFSGNEVQGLGGT